MTTEAGSQVNGNFIGVVVPAFNEARNLEVLIPHIVTVFESNDLLARILVVDDGSTDHTN